MFGVWIIALVALGFCLFLAYLATELKVEEKLAQRDKIMPNWAYPVLRIPFVLMWISIFLAPLCLEFQSEPNRLVVFKDGKVFEKEGYAVVWEWGDFANVPKTVRGRSQVTVLTSNPKSREVSYRYTSSVANLDKYFANVERRKRYSGNTQADIENVIRYQCYEFNEANGKVLAGFYNPADKKQQEEFKHVFEKWMNERLDRDGIQVKAEGFEIR